VLIIVAAQHFITQFKKATTEDVLSKIKDEALEIQKDLIEKSLINPVNL
jgi:hypothetical protein